MTRGKQANYTRVPASSRVNPKTAKGSVPPRPSHPKIEDARTSVDCEGAQQTTKHTMSKHPEQPDI
jgi:hypothetical protein